MRSGVVLSVPAGGVGLLRAWKPEHIAAEIDKADNGIKTALRAGDMDLALTLVGRKVGLKVCAGEIAVQLKPPSYK